MTTDHQNPTHPCPGRCGARVPRHRFACRPCWYRLPKPLREAILVAWPNDRAAHRQAMADAIDWYRAERGNVDDAAPAG